MSLRVDFSAVQRTATVPDRVALLDEARTLARLGEVSPAQMMRFEGRLQRHYDYELDGLRVPPANEADAAAPTGNAREGRRFTACGGVSVMVGAAALGLAAWLLAAAQGDGFVPAPWRDQGLPGWLVAATLLACALVPVCRRDGRSVHAGVSLSRRSRVARGLSRLGLGMATGLALTAATLQLDRAWGSEFVAREAMLDQLTMPERASGACQLQAELVLDLRHGRICLDGRWSGPAPRAGEHVLVSGRRSALGTHINEVRPAPRREGAGRPAW